MSQNNAHDYGWQENMEALLLDKLRADLKTAMLNRDVEIRNTIRQIMAEYPKLTVPIVLESGKKTTRPKKPVEITNDDITDIIRGLAKSEKTVLEIKGEKSSGYLRVLESYLPKMANRTDIEAWIRNNIDFETLKSPMQAMGPIMKHFGKRADGEEVKAILQGFLKK